MRLEELKDKPVVSIAEGTELGKARDFLLDESYLQIAALVIGGQELQSMGADGDVRPGCRICARWDVWDECD